MPQTTLVKQFSSLIGVTRNGKPAQVEARSSTWKFNDDSSSSSSSSSKTYNVTMILIKGKGYYNIAEEGFYLDQALPVFETSKKAHAYFIGTLNGIFLPFEFFEEVEFEKGKIKGEDWKERIKTKIESYAITQATQVAKSTIEDQEVEDRNPTETKEAAIKRHQETHFTGSMFKKPNYIIQLSSLDPNKKPKVETSSSSSCSSASATSPASSVAAAAAAAEPSTSSCSSTPTSDVQQEHPLTQSQRVKKLFTSPVAQLVYGASLAAMIGMAYAYSQQLAEQEE